MSEENGSDGHRTIILTEIVNQQMAAGFLAKLLKYEKDDPSKDIVVYIDTPGGYVDSMMSIYDAMQACHVDIVTVGIGKIMSAGCLLLAGGTQGKRYMARNARLMMHAVSGATWGKTLDVEIDAKEQRRLQNHMIRLLAKHTGASSALIKKEFDRGDRFLTARQAIDFGTKGFADHFLGKFPRPKSKISGRAKKKSKKKTKKKRKKKDRR